VPGRTQGPDGGHAAGRGRERQQTREGRHTGADGPAPAQAQAAQRARAYRRRLGLRRQVPRRFRALRHRGIQLPDFRCPVAARRPVRRR